jgi:uncharacterized protein DUF4288
LYELPGTPWYIVELIEEISVEGWPRQVLQRNTRFIYASSPEEAYDQALALGNDWEAAASNDSQKLVCTRFWTLAHLNVIGEDVRAAKVPEQQPPLLEDLLVHANMARTLLPD